MVNGHALTGDVTVTKSDVGLGSVTDDAQLKAADLDTDAALTANSDTKVPSQKAVRSYVDANAGAVDEGDILMTPPPLRVAVPGDTMQPESDSSYDVEHLFDPTLFARGPFDEEFQQCSLAPMTREFSVAGLFAGIGGIERGLGLHGGEAELLCEYWDPAHRVLAARFPDVPLVEDVRDLRSLPKVDLVSAGFPCTDLSQAGRMEGIAVAIGLAIITIDTLCVNLAANVVGPAYDFTAIFPRQLNFARGGYLTALLGIAMMPWKLIESSGGYIFTWLVGYGALLGPVLGIMIADYWWVRRTHIDVDQLYDPQGRYAYGGSGWNPAGGAAFAAAVLPNVPGFLATAFPGTFGGVPAFFKEIYNYAWFVGVVISVAVYVPMMRRHAVAAVQPA